MLCALCMLLDAMKTPYTLYATYTPYIHLTAHHARHNTLRCAMRCSAPQQLYTTHYTLQHHALGAHGWCRGGAQLSEAHELADDGLLGVVAGGDLVLDDLLASGVVNVIVADLAGSVRALPAEALAVVPLGRLRLLGAEAVLGLADVVRGVKVILVQAVLLCPLHDFLLGRLVVVFITGRHEPDAVLR